MKEDVLCENDVSGLKPGRKSWVKQIGASERYLVTDLGFDPVAISRTIERANHEFLGDVSVVKYLGRRVSCRFRSCDGILM